MDINKANVPEDPERVLASLSPEILDRLADLIVAKLNGRNPGVLASQAEGRGFESHLLLHPAILASK